MKRTRLILIVLIIGTLSMVGCSQTKEDIAEEAISNMEEVVEILEGVTDKASTDAAVPKIEAIAEKMNELKTEFEAIGETEEAMGKLMEEKYKDRYEPVMKRLFKESMRISRNPELAKVIKAMKQIK